jgi:Tfp pilus assembly PilM family ATPase
MSQKSINTIGIEFDILGIRAAAMSITSEGDAGAKAAAAYSLQKLEAIMGPFVKDEELIVGLKKIKEKMNIGSGDRVVSCVSGKHVYVTQIPFKRLPTGEMPGALKLEIRKNIPFEFSGATIDYQVLSETGKKSENIQLLVTVVSHALITRHLHILGKAGLKPSIVDALPTAIGNAFHAGAAPCAADDGRPCLVVYTGPSICSLIIECKGLPFFHRNIYFTAEELFGPLKQNNPLAERERTRRLGILSEEIVRSISYYEKTYDVLGVQHCYQLGEYTDNAELTRAITEKAGLQRTNLNLCAHFNMAPPPPQPAKFALAISLAMRQE